MRRVVAAAAEARSSVGSDSGHEDHQVGPQNDPRHLGQCTVHRAVAPEGHEAHEVHFLAGALVVAVVYI